jgi:hypothetical protein
MERQRTRENTERRGLHDAWIRGIIVLIGLRTILLPINCPSGSVVKEEGISRLRAHLRI